MHGILPQGGLSNNHKEIRFCYQHSRLIDVGQIDVKSKEVACLLSGLDSGGKTNRSSNLVWSLCEVTTAAILS